MEQDTGKVSRRLRFEVLRRDGHKCYYCGTTAEAAELTVDHVVPAALGGSNDASNLVTACPACNAGKAATSPDEHMVADVDERAARWAEAMARAAAIQSSRQNERERYASNFDDVWCSWRVGEAGDEPMRPTNWRDSVYRWHDLGLEIGILTALVDDVIPRPVANYRMWRYFCGAVWNVIRERQAIAQALLDGEEV